MNKNLSVIKIIFFGSDKYSWLVLDSLKKEKNIQILRVVSPQTLNSLSLVKSQPPEVGILASFGAIIPKKLLAYPSRGILNLHPSLLPKYRGPSPVQMAILNGEKQTGLTIIKMDEKVDHGPIIAQFKEKILPEDTAESLYSRLFSGGAEVLKKILPAYLKGEIIPQPQNHAQATYTKRLTRKDGFISLSQLRSAIKGKGGESLERMIRAFYPWPGVWTEIIIKSLSRRLKIIKAYSQDNKLILEKVQLEGKKPVSFKQLLEGYPEIKNLLT